MKKVSSQGNINNQKYEALANMSQFYTAIQFAEPSKETYQWKEKEYTMIVKHEGNKKLQEKKRMFLTSELLILNHLLVIN